MHLRCRQRRPWLHQCDGIPVRTATAFSARESGSTCMHHPARHGASDVELGTAWYCSFGSNPAPRRLRFVPRIDAYVVSAASHAPTDEMAGPRWVRSSRALRGITAIWCAHAIAMHVQRAHEAILKEIQAPPSRCPAAASRTSISASRAGFLGAGTHCAACLAALILQHRVARWYHV